MMMYHHQENDMPHENETSFITRTSRTVSGYLPSMDGLWKWDVDFRKNVGAYFAEDNKLERFLIAVTDFGLPIVSGIVITSLAEQEDQTPEEREQHSSINVKMGVAIMTPILVSGLRAWANKHLSYSMGNKITKDMVSGYLQGNTMTIKDHQHRNNSQEYVGPCN